MIGEEARSRPAAATRPARRSASCRRRRNVSLTSRSLARSRSRRVFRRSWNLPFRVRPADMGEAQKVEGLRLAMAALAAVSRRIAAELDQARLVRMQRQREPAQPLAHLRQKPLGIGLVLEAGDDVVGVAHDDDVALGMALRAIVAPRDRRRNAGRCSPAAARSPHLAASRPSPGVTSPSSVTPAFSHLRIRRTTRAIADPMLDETDQPLMAHRVEEPAMSASSIQFTFVRVIPTASASSASCWPRPGRNP